MKNKRLLKILVLVAVVTAIGSISVFGAQTNVKDKIKTLTEQFNSKKAKLEKTGVYDTESQDAKNIKKLGGQIADLTEQTKTEDDYAKELETALYWARKGLEDSKNEQKLCNNDKDRKSSIDKIEKKLNSLDEKIKAKKNKTSNNKFINSVSDSVSGNASDNATYKQLMDEFYKPAE